MSARTITAASSIGRFLVNCRGARVCSAASALDERTGQRYHSAMLPSSGTSRRVVDGEIIEGHDDEQPWKSLLEFPARAAWRASDPAPPESVTKAQRRVLKAGGVTQKQTRSAYVELVASHKSLALRRERERRRLINRTGYSHRAKQRDADILPVFYGRTETLAFMRNRLAPNYAITKRVLEEAKSLLLGCDLNPKRIIDMGIGVGSASAAALEVFGDDIEWVHGIEPSRCMRECAKSFLEVIMEQNSNQQRLTLSSSIATETSSSSFDMALMTYTATELPHVASTLSAAAILWQKLAPNGIFIMIEPGTPDGFNSIRAVRNMLLDCCPPDSEDNEQCHIIAPCTHNGKCPMERYQHDFLRQQNPKTQTDMLPTSTSEEEDQEENFQEEEHDDNEDFDMADFDFDADDDEDIHHGWEEVDDDANIHELLHGDDIASFTHNKSRSGMTDETDRMKGRFCSFVQTMSSGSHLKKGEKFSYLVAQKRQADDDNIAASAVPFQEVRIRDLLVRVYQANQSDKGGVEALRGHVQDLFEQAQVYEEQYLDSEDDELGLELLQGDVNRASFGRIIRAPLKKRGHVYVDYCAAPGRLMRSRITKALAYGVAPGLYTAARKSRWGGLWPDVAGFKDP